MCAFFGNKIMRYVIPNEVKIGTCKAELASPSALTFNLFNIFLGLNISFVLLSIPSSVRSLPLYTVYILLCRISSSFFLQFLMILFYVWWTFPADRNTVVCITDDEGTDGSFCLLMETNTIDSGSFIPYWRFLISHNTSLYKGWIFISFKSSTRNCILIL